MSLAFLVIVQPQRQPTRFILHTGAIADRVHVKRVGTTSAQQRFSRVDHKVDTIAANSNMQGDVQAMQFGIPEYDDLVWDVCL